MKAYVEFLNKHVRKVMVVLMVVNLVAFLGVLKLRINPDFTVFLPNHSVQRNLYDDMVKIFGTGDQIFVVLEEKADPRNMESLNELLNLEKKIESIDGVKSAIGPVPKAVPSGFLKIEKVERVDEKNYKKILEFIDENPAGKVIVEKDGKFYVSFTIFPKDGANTRELLHEIEDVLKSKTFFFSGNVYVQAKVFDYMLLVLFTLPPSAVIVMFFVFKWIIRSKKATFFAIIPAGIGALWIMGVMGWIIGEVSIVTILVPIFTVIMGSADGLHFVSHFLESLSKGKDKKSSIYESFKTVGTAMIMTTLTTMAGFFSLMTVNSPAIKQMGLFSGIGIGLAGVATWTFLPTVLFLAKFEGIGSPKLGLKFSIPNVVGIFLPILVALAFLPGIFMIKTDFNMVDMYRDFTSVRKNVEKVKDVFNVYMPIFAVLKSEKDPVDPDNAKSVFDYEKTLLKSGKVLKVNSYYDVASYITKKLYNLKEPTYPENFAKANFVYILMRRNAPELVNSLLVKNEKSSRIIVFPADLKSGTLQFIEDVSKGHGLSVTGLPYLIKEMNDNVITEQIKTLGLALFLVFIMLLVTMKRFKLAILSIVPLVCTMVVLFGFMGYLGIDLSLITINMAGVTLGVGVDYAIHYVALYKKYRSSKRAFEFSSKPIIANALGLAVGFTVMNFSPFTFHVYLSAIMWVTMLSSSILSLVFLSSVLKGSKNSRDF